MTLKSGLQVYLNEISAAPLLTVERERALARRLIRENDVHAREEMIRSNLRLVVNIAKNYAKRGMALQDLIAEGNIGLLKSIEGFNPDMNIRFSTYASWWIKQSIRRALITSLQPIHVPAYMVEMLARWKLAMAEMEDQLGRLPRLEELARHMEVSVEKVQIIHRAVRTLRSAPQAQADDDDGMALHELVHDHKTPSPDKVILTKDAVQTVYRLLSALDQREAEILRLRFGLENCQPLTLQEIGEKIGVSRERIRQIEADALCKLKEYLSADRLPLFNEAEDTDGMLAIREQSLAE